MLRPVWASLSPPQHCNGATLDQVANSPGSGSSFTISRMGSLRTICAGRTLWVSSPEISSVRCVCRRLHPDELTTGWPGFATRLAPDSLVEGDGFEPLVPRRTNDAFRGFPVLTAPGTSLAPERRISRERDRGFESAFLHRRVPRRGVGPEGDGRDKSG